MTPCASMRPTTPASRCMASRYRSRSPRPSVSPATRWWSTNSCRTTTPGRRRERIDDPPVRVGVVADVVERDVGVLAAAPSRPGARPRRPSAARARAAAARCSRRSRSARAEAARSTRPSSGKHPRRSSASQVTRSASRCPRAPTRGLVSMLGEPEQRRRQRPRASARATTPFSRSATISSGPPASMVVTTGFSDRNASYGTRP